MPESYAEYEYTHGDATFLFHVHYRRVDGEIEIDRAKLESVEVEIVGPGGVEVLTWERASPSSSWPADMQYRQEFGANRNCHEAMVEACERDWEARRRVEDALKTRKG